jgi:tripartite-type tricarboxylate transporter receptor subunit TctC
VLLGVIAAISSASIVDIARANTPPLKIIVPSNPGNGSDIVARKLASRLESILDRPVIVENKPGARGIIGTNSVAKSNPDGNTILFGFAAAMSVEPVFNPGLPYDPIKDLAPIIMIATPSPILVVRGDSPIRSYGDLIQAAKKNPGVVSLGVASSTYRLIAEMIQEREHITFNQIPYSSFGDSQIDLLGGRLDVNLDSPQSVINQIKTGDMRAIISFDRARNPQLPDVPTASELDMEALTAIGWMGVLAPKGTSTATIDNLYDKIDMAISEPEFKKFLSDMALPSVKLSTQEFSDLIKDSLTRNQDIAQRSGILAKAEK